jgi:hypothetical protein
MDVTLLAFQIGDRDSFTLLLLDNGRLSAEDFLSFSDDFDIVSELAEATIGMAKIKGGPHGGKPCIANTYSLSQFGIAEGYQRKGYGGILMLLCLLFTGSEGAGLTSDRTNATSLELGYLFDKIVKEEWVYFRKTADGHKDFDYSYENEDSDDDCIQPTSSEGKYDLGGSIALYPKVYTRYIPLLQGALDKGDALRLSLPIALEDEGALYSALSDFAFADSFKRSIKKKSSRFKKVYSSFQDLLGIYAAHSISVRFLGVEV